MAAGDLKNAPYGMVNDKAAGVDYYPPNHPPPPPGGSADEPQQ